MDRFAPTPTRQQFLARVRDLIATQVYSEGSLAEGRVFVGPTQQISVLVYKLAQVTIGVKVSYWADRALFRNAPGITSGMPRSQKSEGPIDIDLRRRSPSGCRQVLARATCPPRAASSSTSRAISTASSDSPGAERKRTELSSGAGWPCVPSAKSEL